MKPTIGSLFAGIGGFDLGFERAGFETVWQVEINDYCRKVLARHFPHAERFGDIRECGGHNLKPVDVICGGFPCQDISNAGLRAGIEGEQSGLWSEMHRIIGELRPRIVLVENVAALLGRGMGRVLGDLSEIGYDAEWEVVSAADVGAPHLRERVWILAYPNSDGRNAIHEGQGRCAGTAFGAVVAPSQFWRNSCGQPIRGAGQASGNGVAVESGEIALAHPDLPRLEGRDSAELRECAGERITGTGSAYEVCDTTSERLVSAAHAGVHRTEEGAGPRHVQPERSGWWLTEPDVGRVAHGVPARVDRLRGLGNAVVPQIPELYARRIKSLLEVAG